MNKTWQFIFYLLYIKDNLDLQEQEKKFKETIAEIDKLKREFKTKEKCYSDYCSQCDVIKPIFEALSKEQKILMYYILSMKEEELRNSKSVASEIKTSLVKYAHDIMYMLSLFKNSNTK